MDSNTAWNGHNQDLSAGGHDEFQQFMDMGMNGLDGNASFDFQDFAAPQQNGHGHPVRQSPMQAMDATMVANNHNDHMMGVQKGNMMVSHMPMNGQNNFMGSGNERMNMAAQGSGSMGNSLSDLDAQIQQLQMQRQLQQQRNLLEQQQNYYVHHRVIPPTPNSMEMQSRERQRNSLQQAQMRFDGSDMLNRQHDMAFTPLVSPAVTPLDSNFNILPDYAMSGAYFSPLTSPAIHAQNSNDYSGLYPSSQGQSSVGHSPTEMHLDLPQPASHAAMQRKHSGGASKKAPSKPRPTSRAVRQSPIVKPQRRKPTITSISAEVLSELVEPALQIPQPTSSHNSSQYGNSVGNSVDCSPENDSISPETLTEMAPPPIPAARSVKSSPFLSGQTAHPRVQQLISGNTNPLAPATPASLMKLARSKEGLASPSLDLNMDDDQLMEGFSLPDAASPNDMLQIDTQVTPTLEADQTPILSLPPAAISEPASTMPSPSPRLKAQKESSSAGMTPSSIRKTPKLAAKGSKRHGSSSVHASPALLPKISPSIKPMVQGSVSDDAASMLLATKSNYQNILEGTHLPGVSYPTELSTNLTSRRTIHKLAEQGRRNRINFALQEMASLLPVNKGKGAGSTGEDKDKEDGGGSGGGSSKGGAVAASKASTVEQAIEYIKHLKSEVDKATKRAEEAERKLKEQEQGGMEEQD